ncbi:Six-hairpin glycosidase [Penicillium brevicompactum]|uniref:Six-hairpin glycosidase n=1 Tax=Penicillium brevicompactum TaxID=5074 RepID=UPI002541008E|nr:Six-hairpin glycosidase [Penicillium brevicompactum]KAJ5321633.1 Six-hairpin glycosidase [Penicillium brevicompactum]
MAKGNAAMTAAELCYLQDTPVPYWASLAEGVFHAQFPPGGAGYNVKNAISNGGLFQLSARLARYTRNQTYTNWAVSVGMG